MDSTSPNCPKSQNMINPGSQVTSTGEPPRKFNLSFSLNFDMENGNSEDSTDSETADLQVDVSEVDDYEPSNKQKRDAIDPEETSIINEMEEEIERQLDAKAAKTNLTATNVKNILKHVITNEHVMAMVQKRLHNSDEDFIFEPKLTRAKAKELAKTQPTLPWPITPAKKTPPSEVQVLIEEELPEDSSDEEYRPDQQSDDEREGENSVSSDLDSQPSTPKTPADLNTSIEESKSQVYDVQYDSEGIFKIPGIPHVPTEEESIGQRTRSKLSLSETPLEQIEQAFIPPDITTDMYDWDCDVDEDWNNFLKEFTRPLVQDPVIEDDPEADPEYNILEDEEDLDKEELRMDKAVKVTRKELNDLVAELSDYFDVVSKQQEEIPKKKRTNESTHFFTEPHNTPSMVELLPVLAEPELPKLVDYEQRQLLGVQFEQHVQLMTQHFAMTYMHPELHQLSATCKKNLKSIRYMSSGPDSAFDIRNLSAALKLVEDWEVKLSDEKFRSEYKNMMVEEIALEKFHRAKSKYVPKFHPELEKLFAKSEALMYPQLLPHNHFRSKPLHPRTEYSSSEENLIALGLEQFTPYVASLGKKFSSSKAQLVDVSQMIVQYLLPTKETIKLANYIICRRKPAAAPNPIKHYYATGRAPRTIHYVPSYHFMIAPKDQSPELLPPHWQQYLSNAKLDENCKTFGAKDIFKKRADVPGKFIFDPGAIGTGHFLCNPVVNMLPIILPKRDKDKRRTNQNPDKSDEKIPRESDSRSLPSTSSAAPSKIPGEAPKDLELRNLRKTTPRLAKMRGAQNMKPKSQVSKNLSACTGAKPKGKDEPKDEELSSQASVKGDDEDEIAELMKASTTIKKITASRKKAKQARELENIKRILQADNDMSEEETSSKFASSCLQKLHRTLETTNPEVFKSVIKVFLDYCKQLENVQKVRTSEEATPSCSSSTNDVSEGQPSPEKSVSVDSAISPMDQLAINFYNEICEKLRDYPEMCSDFLLLLKPHQAAIMGKAVEYIMLKKITEFVNVAQIYFAKQPSRLAKVMQAISHLASLPSVTSDNLHTVMGTVLKGHPLVLDLFLQTLPTVKPPDSLFDPKFFENFTCPLGPHDKSKDYDKDAAELYESIELPQTVSQEDPYGGDNCKCDCHFVDDPSTKSTTEHCVSCGTRFLNGKIYLQTSGGLRPAKITYPGTENERLENLTRISLRTERFVPPPPPKRRRKSSKNDTAQEDPKSFAIKEPPEEGQDKTTSTKLRKRAKSPPKLSLSSSTGSTSLATTSSSSVSDFKKNAKTPESPVGGQPKPLKREKKLEAKAKFEVNFDPPLREDFRNEEGDEDDNDDAEVNNDAKFEGAAKIKSETSDRGLEEPPSTSSLEETDGVPSDSDTAAKSIIDMRSGSTRTWTRHEDAILLQAIKKEYSESTLTAVSQTLGDRTLEEVKQRCSTLLTLLEKMM